MPASTVYVGRPTRWGNPWVAGDPGRLLIIHHAAEGMVTTLRCDIDRIVIADEAALQYARGRPRQDKGQTRDRPQFQTETLPIVS